MNKKLYRLDGVVMTIADISKKATGKEIFYTSKYCRKKGEYVDVLNYALLVNNQSFSVSQIVYIKTLANVQDVTDEKTKDEFLANETRKLVSAMRNFGDQIDYNRFCREKSPTDIQKYEYCLNYHRKKIAVKFKN